MGLTYDFSGWATRNDLKCSDGRVIKRDAFKGNHGKKVPLVWNHQHDDPENVLGHALLENREDGVYVYGTFNDTDTGRRAKELIQHGDINALSIYAGQLKHSGSNVIHGVIREVSLVLAGANPGAFIDSVIAHGEEEEEEGTIYTGFGLELSHSEESIEETSDDGEKEEVMDNVIEHSEEKAENKEKTIGDILKTLNEEQTKAVEALVGMALEEGNDQEDEEEDSEMKHNVFENDSEVMSNDAVLSHSDETEIIKLAKSSGCGSFKEAVEMYVSKNETLSHAAEDSTFPGTVVDQLFPDYKDVKPGAPEMITNDQSWVESVINKTHKSPISRIRTRQVDIRDEDLRALGYKKGDKKSVSGVIKLYKRTTDPQTVYRKDALHRDDIVDITDFSIVDYQYKIMQMNLKEEIATAIMIGDGRDEDDENKIHEQHIRSIWNDDELYTIHADVDIAKTKTELQGGDTSKYFGDNYIYAEAIITAALYSREKYKGSGNLEFYCTPHLLNVMLLARDRNGRRIYDSKTDLAAALNVSAIHTVEQFEGKTRTDKTGAKKKLLGIFVNLGDYQIGSTKGGEITKFSQFDIDFNQEKTLIETRLSGALTKIFSAIALEEPVTAGTTPTTPTVDPEEQAAG